jgi:rfaE bifunctional protein kinase chain/domain
MNAVAQSSNPIEEALSHLSESRVAVFGDFCLDAYWWLAPKGGEVSLETGLPIQHIREQLYTLGGAGNVVANLIELGVGEVKAIGVIGRDAFGKEMMRLLTERGAEVSGMIVEDSWQTMVYAKPYSDNQEKSRLDFGAFNSLQEKTIDLLLEAVDRAAYCCDAVILNQQVSPGISTPEVIASLNQIIKKYPATHFIGDARNHAALYNDVIYKLNAREAAELLGEPTNGNNVSVVRAKAYAESLHKRTGRPVFVTRGEHGIVVAHANDVYDIPGIQIVDHTDPVGAGDTAVAALTAVLASGGDPVTAGKIANIAASITVRKLRMTGTATPQEIIAVGEEPDYVYLPELADDVRHAHYHDGTEIEIAEPLRDGLRIRHAVFDHDGTLSTLREGWELMMEPMMVRAIFGSRFAEADTAQHKKVLEAVRLFVDQTTGIQTLVQMQGLVRMVRKFGYVPEDEILDERDYKAHYNEQLLAMVKRRIEKLERGELEPADFEIKNASRLLRHLQACGVKLYLASGTDESDVRYEAEVMGYADVFEGKIFGAVGDVNVEAKKLVLERIIRENNLSGEEFVVFGDGPVEIRETRKRGGVCVGVASDEVRRFGLNPAKRTRLIRAGAHLVVSDFSQVSSLLSLLCLS